MVSLTHSQLLAERYVYIWQKSSPTLQALGYPLTLHLPPAWGAFLDNQFAEPSSPFGKVNLLLAMHIGHT